MLCFLALHIFECFPIYKKGNQEIWKYAMLDEATSSDLITDCIIASSLSNR